MDIEIRIERPLILLLLGAGFVWGAVWAMHQGMPVEAAVGGDDSQSSVSVVKTEDQIRLLREEQTTLDQSEQILRDQLAELLREKEVAGNDPALVSDISAATQRLVALLQDRRMAEAELKTSLMQMQAAEEGATAASRNTAATTPQTRIKTFWQWPVAPLLGISATFHDPAYKKRFGMEHNAIDIPVDQGSDVHAAADGVVVTVSDKGMGFNSLVIEHANGYSTLYGHVSKFLVSEGQHVRAGQTVALSGGRPGTAGAGLFTTGPHLHFELHANGTPVDPLAYLPSLGEGN